MGYPIPEDQAKALRARLAEFKATHPDRMGPIIASVGPSGYYAFIGGKRSVVAKTARKIEALIAVAPATPSGIHESRPRGPGQKGRVYAYLPKAEQDALLENVRSYRESHGMTVERFAKKTGVTQSHMGKVVRGDALVTLQMAEKLRKAIGRAPTSTALVLPNVESAPVHGKPVRAPRNIATMLREDTSKILMSRFAGAIPAFARELGITAERLSKFLDGGTISLDESATIANRLDVYRKEPAAPPGSALTMLRAAISIEGWREAPPSGEMEPPELRARKLVEKWGHEAIAIVLQLASGAA